MNDFLLGFDYSILRTSGVALPIRAPLASHGIVVGGTGSGKSTGLLFWLYQMKRVNSDIKLTIIDFKNSGEFEGITSDYASFDDSYEKLKEVYDKFCNIPEGDVTIKYIIIDEVAGMLSYYSTKGKDGKVIVEKIQQIMASILMLGRSRNFFLWLCMQRFTASIFPSGSGAVDNFMIQVGLGRLTVEGKKSLFAGEKLASEEEMIWGKGKGLVLIDGEPLKAIVLPRLSKKKLLKRLTE